MATQLFKNNATQSRTVRVGVYQNKPKIFMDGNDQASGIFVKLLEQIIAQYDFHETLDRRLL
jgi:hypothetical protein